MLRLKEKVALEMTNISTLMEKYYANIDKFKDKEPENLELLGLSNILHSFYTGIEKVFIIIKQDIEGKKITGEGWHKILLMEMRDLNVISKELYINLLEYLSYRHVYRHAYSFEIKWSKMQHLILKLNDIWKQFQEEIGKYIEFNKIS